MKLLKFAKVLEIKIFNFSRLIVVQLGCICKFMLIIKTSTDSHKTMKIIANELLNNKLAACVNMIPRMRAKYVMDGRITEVREVILLIKTTKKLENKVYKINKELHNYEIPEISTIQTSNVDKDYEKWLKDFVEN